MAELLAELLDVHDLAVAYGRRGFGRTAGPPAVDGVDLHLDAGASVAVVGESGSGKSTLARAVAGLVRPQRGRIRLGGDPVTYRRTPAQRRLVQLVFQDPYSSLNPRMTVEQTLAEVLRVHGLARGAAVRRRTAELLDLVQLPAAVARSHPRRLSGGQRQRVSIARALATEPRLLVADEPVSALDVSVQSAVLNLFADLRAEIGLGLLLISHNLAVVRHVSDHVAVMHRGRFVETGPTARVLESPSHAYTQTLLGSVPSLVPRRRA